MDDKLADLRTEQILTNLVLESALHFSVAVSMGMEAGHFTQDPAKVVWKALRLLYDGDIIPDSPRMVVLDKLRHAGSQEVVEELTGYETATFEFSGEDASIVRPMVAGLKELARLRNLRREAANMVVELEGGGGPSQLWERAGSVHTQMTKIILEQETGPLSASLQWERAQEVIKGGGIGFVSSGLRPIDEILGGGFHRSRVNVISAYTSHGKSNQAIYFLDNILHGTSDPGAVLLFTPELTQDRVAERRLSRWARIPNTEIRKAEHGRDISHLEEKMKGFIVDDTIAPSASYMMMRSRAVQEQYGLKAVAFDYAERIGEPGEMHARIMTAMITAERIAKRFNVPFLMVSQLNRDGLQAKSPNISHLAGSSALEKLSSSVLVSMWPAKRAEQLHRPFKGESVFQYITYVAKNTEGETGRADYYFEPQFHSFTTSNPELTINSPAPF